VLVQEKRNADRRGAINRHVDYAREIENQMLSGADICLFKYKIVRAHI